MLLIPVVQLSALLFGVTAASAPDVTLTSGTFRGVSTSNGTEKWLGIPYALPPVGSLRFKAPVPISKPSTGVKDASSFGDACPQPASTSLGAAVGEDCLFLNVGLTTFPLQQWPIRARWLI